jgi:hypothetical protein
MPQSKIVVILQKLKDAVILLTLEPWELPLTLHAIETFYFYQITFLVFQERCCVEFVELIE